MFTIVLGCLFVFVSVITMFAISTGSPDSESIGGVEKSDYKFDVTNSPVRNENNTQKECIVKDLYSEQEQHTVVNE